MNLSEKNRRVHTHLAGLYAVFIEALLQRESRNDAGNVRDRWEEFRTALDRHAGLEESDILPSAESLSITGKGDPRVIRHDHRLLDEALGSVEELLGELETHEPGRRVGVIARNLQTLARFEQVFEHHTVRECDFLYAALDERADEGTRAKVSAVLETSLRE